MFLTHCHEVDTHKDAVEVGDNDRDVKASLQSSSLSMVMESASKGFTEALKVGVGE